MVDCIVSTKNINRFKDKLWCKLYIDGKLKDFIQNYYIDENNTWQDTMDRLQITHRRLSECIKYYNLKKPRNKINDRVKQSIENKYGCKSYFECADFNQKRKETMINKYGVEYTLQSKELTEKVQDTCEQLYGYRNLFNDISLQKKFNSNSWSDKGRNNRKENSINKYGVAYVTQRNYNTKSAEIINDKQKMVDFIKSLNAEDRTIINIANLLELSYDVVNSHYKEYNLKEIVPLQQFRSLPEIEITNFIQTIYDGTIILNTREIITPFELDIYLPKINLAIEFNGNYWHDKNNQEREENKSNLCKNKNIYLIHIWEDDWNINKNAELDKIKSSVEGRVG